MDDYGGFAPPLPLKDGVDHEVWVLDATTAYNELVSAHSYQPVGYAFRRLGSEDLTSWTGARTVLRRSRPTDDVRSRTNRNRAVGLSPPPAPAPPKF